MSGRSQGREATLATVRLDAAVRAQHVDQFTVRAQTERQCLRHLTAPLLPPVVDGIVLQISMRPTLSTPGGACCGSRARRAHHPHEPKIAFLHGCELARCTSLRNGRELHLRDSYHPLCFCALTHKVSGRRKLACDCPLDCRVGLHHDELGAVCERICGGCVDSRLAHLLL